MFRAFYEHAGCMAYYSSFFTEETHDKNSSFNAMRMLVFGGSCFCRRGHQHGHNARTHWPAGNRSCKGTGNCRVPAKKRPVQINKRFGKGKRDRSKDRGKAGRRDHGYKIGTDRHAPQENYYKKNSEDFHCKKTGIWGKEKHPFPQSLTSATRSAIGPCPWQNR